MDLKDRLLEVERQLWKNDPDLYRDNLIAEAILVFPDTGAVGRDFAVDAIHQENAENRRWAEVSFADVTARNITDDVAALTYRAMARWNHETTGGMALCSSIYVRRHGAWKLALHHHSLVQG
ncbi:nuclear transport factor 2 family protein [Mesorhizobium sp. LHD-90]|uniref:nuclear transport factor 2 family protein n=1 Tax=Mesorhizobium sp. LHD-90 TaxID=3071414 RepID=UPI0027E20E8F|nr:nuclear transport factor 2 family protein [Mesorhizobium sp. LHD-90]MDQ6432969.1 nuclear transport factor 2 family protein [Mesorhizobium sp. LHD-90]